MLRKSSKFAGVAIIALGVVACQTAQDTGNTTDTTTNAEATTGASAGTSDTTAGATAGTGTTTGGTGTSIPALVNVNLQNVLNDLSVALQIDRANIPVNAQIPIEVAANVCGVSVSVLGASTGGQASCTAKTASPELAQVVQQQIAAGGNVGGGAQGGSTATTGTTTTTTTNTATNTPNSI